MDNKIRNKFKHSYLKSQAAQTPLAHVGHPAAPLAAQTFGAGEQASQPLSAEQSAFYVPNLKQKLQELKYKSSANERKCADGKGSLINFNYNRVPNYQRIQMQQLLTNDLGQHARHTRRQRIFERGAPMGRQRSSVTIEGRPEEQLQPMIDFLRNHGMAQGWRNERRTQSQVINQQLIRMQMAQNDAVVHEQLVDRYKNQQANVAAWSSNDSPSFYRSRVKFDLSQRMQKMDKKEVTPKKNFEKAEKDGDQEQPPAKQAPNEQAAAKPPANLGMVQEIFLPPINQPNMTYYNEKVALPENTSTGLRKNAKTSLEIEKDPNNETIKKKMLSTQTKKRFTNASDHHSDELLKSITQMSYRYPNQQAANARRHSQVEQLNSDIKLSLDDAAGSPEKKGNRIQTNKTPIKISQTIENRTNTKNFQGVKFQTPNKRFNQKGPNSNRNASKAKKVIQRQVQEESQNHSKDVFEKIEIIKNESKMNLMDIIFADNIEPRIVDGDEDHAEARRAAPIPFQIELMAQQTQDRPFKQFETEMRVDKLSESNRQVVQNTNTHDDLDNSPENFSLLKGLGSGLVADTRVDPEAKSEEEIDQQEIMIEDENNYQMNEAGTASQAHKRLEVIEKRDINTKSTEHVGANEEEDNDEHAANDLHTLKNMGFIYRQEPKSKRKTGTFKKVKSLKSDDYNNEQRKGFQTQNKQSTNNSKSRLEAISDTNKTFDDSNQSVQKYWVAESTIDQWKAESRASEEIHYMQEQQMMSNPKKDSFHAHSESGQLLQEKLDTLTQYANNKLQFYLLPNKLIKLKLKNKETIVKNNKSTVRQPANKGALPAPKSRASMLKLMRLRSQEKLQIQREQNQAKQTQHGGFGKRQSIQIEQKRNEVVGVHTMGRRHKSVVDESTNKTSLNLEIKALDFNAQQYEDYQLRTGSQYHNGDETVLKDETQYENDESKIHFSDLDEVKVVKSDYEQPINSYSMDRRGNNNDYDTSNLLQKSGPHSNSTTTFSVYMGVIQSNNNSNSHLMESSRTFDNGKEQAGKADLTEQTKQSQNDEIEKTHLTECTKLTINCSDRQMKEGLTSIDSVRQLSHGSKSIVSSQHVKFMMKQGSSNIRNSSMYSPKKKNAHKRRDQLKMGRSSEKKKEERLSSQDQEINKLKIDLQALVREASTLNQKQHFDIGTPTIEEATGHEYLEKQPETGEVEVEQPSHQTKKKKVNINKLRKELRDGQIKMDQLLQRGKSMLKRDSNNEISSTQLRNLLLEMQNINESLDIKHLQRKPEERKDNASQQSLRLITEEKEQQPQQENEFWGDTFQTANVEGGKSTSRQHRMTPFQNQFITFMHESAPEPQINQQDVTLSLNLSEFLDQQLEIIQNRKKALSMLKELMSEDQYLKFVNCEQADEILDYLASKMDLLQQYFIMKKKKKKDMQIYKMESNKSQHHNENVPETTLNLDLEGIQDNNDLGKRDDKYLQDHKQFFNHVVNQQSKAVKNGGKLKLLKNQFEQTIEPSNADQPSQLLSRKNQKVQQDLIKQKNKNKLQINTSLLSPNSTLIQSEQSQQIHKKFLPKVLFKPNQKNINSALRRESLQPTVDDYHGQGEQAAPKRNEEAIATLFQSLNQASLSLGDHPPDRAPQRPNQHTANYSQQKQQYKQLIHNLIESQNENLFEPTYELISPQENSNLKELEDNNLNMTVKICVKDNKSQQAFDPKAAAEQ